MSRRPHGTCVLLLAAGVAAPAAAHSPIPGIGAFYSGALHPVIAPALLIGLLALGLLLGQCADGAIVRVRTALAAYGAALLAGLALHGWVGEIDTDRLLLFCGALAGGAVAAAWRLPPAVRLSLAVVVGLGTGLASTPSGVEGRAYATMLVGTVLGSMLLPAWVTAMVTLPQPAWVKIAVRVLGSWLFAAAMLVLSLSFAPARVQALERSQAPSSASVQAPR
jgi:urease accessory protein